MEAIMFPHWMTDMLAHARCGHCNEPQTAADIQIVGVRRPEECEAFHAEPVFVMVMNCNACGQFTNHAMRRPGGEATDAIVRFIVLIKQECQGKKPPLNIPGLGKKRERSAPATPLHQSAAAPPRPSRRDGQSDTPPSQREIQAFLRRLRKASFRSGSKGFKDWMKDIGADPEAGGDAAGDEDQTT
jgi:hypothetical protein